MTEVLFIVVVIIVAYVIYVIAIEQKVAQGYKQSAGQSPESGSQVKNAFQASVYRFGDVTGHEPYLGEIEKALTHVTTTLHEEAKTVTSEALDVIKHPRHYAPLEASLAVGAGGESLGEIVGASLGTVFGPECTVIGAEVGGMEV